MFQDSWKQQKMARVTPQKLLLIKIQFECFNQVIVYVYVNSGWKHD